MKILHCADIHLDSPMTTHLDSKKAKERRYELLLAFKGAVKYAYVNYFDAIIIAGDLFDGDQVYANTRSELLEIINEYKDIVFYYIEGNHDAKSFIGGMDNIPENLKTFDDTWKSYDAGDGVVITGVEITENVDENMYSSLKLDSDKYNIVILHGDLRDGELVHGSHQISAKKLANKHIDYLAMGHIHSFSRGNLDSRGVYAYPGCLEGRGFDETGDHGFIVVDTDKGNQKEAVSFIPFAKRKVFDIEVDISEHDTSNQVINSLNEALSEEGVNKTDMVRISLTGQIAVNSALELEYVRKNYADEYYYIDIKDSTCFYVNPNTYINDISLKGEFVRTVLAKQDLSEDDKARIIRCGLMALSGEKGGDAV